MTEYSCASSGTIQNGTSLAQQSSTDKVSHKIPNDLTIFLGLTQPTNSLCFRITLRSSSRTFDAIIIQSELPVSIIASTILTFTMYFKLHYERKQTDAITCVSSTLRASHLIVSCCVCFIYT